MTRRELSPARRECALDGGQPDERAIAVAKLSEMVSDKKPSGRRNYYKPAD
jgi:hypothetical protein